VGIDCACVKFDKAALSLARLLKPQPTTQAAMTKTTAALSLRLLGGRRCGGV